MQTILETIASQVIAFACITPILFAGWWLRKAWVIKQEQRGVLAKRATDSFENLLTFHSQLFIDLSLGGEGKVNPFQDQPHLAGKLCLWGSDEVVREYGEYLLHRTKEDRELEPKEIHFAKAILAFRKDELKRKNKDLTPRHIVSIFNAGWRKPKHP